MKITVVGLGTNAKDLTLSGIAAIEQSDYILVKTEKSGTFDYFSSKGIKVATCDGLYNSAENFDVLNELIVERVIKRATTHKHFVFCVNGSGNDDTAVQLLSTMPNIELDIIFSVSNTANILKYYPLSTYMAVSAIQLCNVLVLPTDIPLIITEVYDIDTASSVKLKLLESFDGIVEVSLFIKGELNKLPLCEIDRMSGYDYATTLYIPLTPIIEKKQFGYSDLISILRVLRGENGCSWDKAQTHKTIRHNTIEEAYELADAIDNNNIDGIIEETGDMLMQSLFHIEIGREEDEFDYSDVYTRLCKKLIFRHSHIFGTDKVSSAEEALKIWEKNKIIEKQLKTTTQNLLDVPMSMTALMRASKIQHRAAKVGFDWDNVQGAVDKVLEEIGEVTQVLQQKSIDKDALEGEIGDVFFALINVSRFLDVDAEVALSRTTNKFIKRFTYIENTLKNQGKELKDSNLQEMDALWNEAKKLEKQC
ncbi:MAG: nucleoside triphosphate pyrophosphohydrolase [Clostridia bacterium]